MLSGTQCRRTCPEETAGTGLEVMAAGDCSAFGLESAPKYKPPSSRHPANSRVQPAKQLGGSVDKNVRAGETVILRLTATTVVQMLALPSASRIAAMAAGANHSVVCLADQTIWTTGFNFFGQLAIGVDGSKQSAFAPLDIRLPIVSVACGTAHTMLVTLYGELYASGTNTSGQLGLQDFEDRLVLTRSDLSDSNVISVAAGNNHTLAVTKLGELYSFGNNCEGQLGISRLQDQESRTFCNRTDNLTSTATPTLVQFEPELAASRQPLAFEVLQLSCGARHSVAIVRTWRMDTHEVVSERDLFSWGSNRHGQLGKPAGIEFQGTPRWVQIHSGENSQKLAPRSTYCMS